MGQLQSLLPSRADTHQPSHRTISGIRQQQRRRFLRIQQSHGGFHKPHQCHRRRPREYVETEQHHRGVSGTSQSSECASRSTYRATRIVGGGSGYSRGATITTTTPTTTTTIETAGEHATTIATIPHETKRVHGKFFLAKTSWRTAKTSHVAHVKFGDQKERIMMATVGPTDIACIRLRTPAHYATTNPTGIKTVPIVQAPWEVARMVRISIDRQGTTTN